MSRERPPEAHRHGWAVVDFFVEDDRPMMRQSCACGASRAIRAWDRTWSPDGGEGAMQLQSPDEPPLVIP